MTDRYAVFGHPIAHSLSPRIHRQFAVQTGQDLSYEAIDAGPDVASFERTLRAFRRAGGQGANVTVPFKLAALECAASADAAARLAGAANTLRFVAGRIEARNTDGSGLVRDIQQHLRFPLAGRRILLLGAGGAARGVLLPLAQAGAAAIRVANRTAAKAEALVAAAAPHAPAVGLTGCGLAALSSAPAYDLIINATAASLQGVGLDLPPRLIAPGALAYDLMYGHGPTPFLRWARTAGAAHVADGAGMLVEQAAEAFAWWRGVRPDTAAARALMALTLE